MSVTISIEGAPYEKYQPDPESEPDWWDERPCEGFYDMNMANLNFVELMRTLHCFNEANDYCGLWDMSKIEAVKERCEFLLGTGLSDTLVKETVRSDNLIVFGRDRAYVERRLAELVRILETALKHNMKVVMS